VSAFGLVKAALLTGGAFVVCLFLALACSREGQPPPQAPGGGAGVAERGAAPEAAGGAAGEPTEEIDLEAILAPYDKVLASYAAREEGEAAALDWKTILEGYDPAAREDPAGVAERGGINVLGCELTLDFNAVARCLNGKIQEVQRDVDRRVRAARDELTASFTRQLQEAEQLAKTELRRAAIAAARAQSQVSSLQSQLQTLQTNLKAEVDRAVREAQAQANATLSDLQGRLAAAQQLAAKAQQDAARELQRATNLQAMASNLQKQLSDLQKGIILQIDWQKQIVSGLQTLQLDSLFQCLAEEAQAGQFDLAQALQQFAANPPAFVQKVFDDAVKQLGTSFDRFLGEELTALGTGRPLPTGSALVRRALDKLGVLAEGVPGGRCIFEHVRPQLERSAGAVAQIAMQAAAKLESEARRVLNEKIIPELFKGINNTLGEVLAAQLKQAGIPGLGGADTVPPQIAALLLTEDEMKAVARAVLFRRNVSERFRIAELNIKSLLDPGTAPAALAGHMDNLHKLIQGTADYESLYLEIGVEMLRAVAHKYMKSKEVGHGGHLLDQAIGLLQTGEGSVEKVLSGLCGLIPEAGAAVCAVVEEVLELVWSNVAVVGIEGAAQGFINEAIDQLVDGLKAELLKKSSLATIRRSVGPLGEVLRALPHEQAIGLWAGAVMKDELEMLNRHFTNVASLAKAARG
jgi:hypothetical protein